MGQLTAIEKYRQKLKEKKEQTKSNNIEQKQKNENTKKEKTPNTREKEQENDSNKIKESSESQLKVEKYKKQLQQKKQSNIVEQKQKVQDNIKISTTIPTIEAKKKLNEKSPNSIKKPNLTIEKSQSNPQLIKGDTTKIEQQIKKGNNKKDDKNSTKIINKGTEPLKVNSNSNNNEIINQQKQNNINPKDRKKILHEKEQNIQVKKTKIIKKEFENFANLVLEIRSTKEGKYLIEYLIKKIIKDEISIIQMKKELIMLFPYLNIDNIKETEIKDYLISKTKYKRKTRKRTKKIKIEDIENYIKTYGKKEIEKLLKK